METIFNLDQTKESIRQIEAEVELDSFWTNNQQAHTVFKTLNQLKQTRDSYHDIQTNLNSIETGLELLQASEDPDILAEVSALIQTVEQSISAMEIQCLLSHDWDPLNCIFSIQSGAGGTDAQDWAGMLLRMYTRWFESRTFTVSLTDIAPGDEAGIKSATLLVSGSFCYGFCKNEIGIHRLVRQSPFNANAKRQTSFAAVDVIPQFGDDYKNIHIDPKDVRIDTYRASGAGGQHVNKTDSAVRITHIPTGIVAQSQAQRSQGANKETALSILTSRIMAQLEKEQTDKIADLKGTNSIAWGNQIRSYVFHPYKLVKDHRTNEETPNIHDIMDGKIQSFVESHLRFSSNVSSTNPTPS